MSDWSLATLLDGLHADIERRLEHIRKSFGHPSAKGGASEKVWLELLQAYLPKRYGVESGFVVDSNGAFSDQIDVMVFDRQYSPFIFNKEGEHIVPAESIYAIFEAKQAINPQQIRYAHGKIQSVRKLHRTSLPIPYAAGVHDPKTPIPIIGGLLTFGSDWSPAMGKPMLEILGEGDPLAAIDIGCVAAHGHFYREPTTLSSYTISEGGKPAVAFLFKLIAMLQARGTVPMMDVLAYSKWLADGN